MRQFDQLRETLSETKQELEEKRQQAELLRLERLREQEELIRQEQERK